MPYMSQRWNTSQRELLSQDIQALQSTLQLVSPTVVLAVFKNMKNMPFLQTEDSNVND